MLGAVRFNDPDELDQTLTWLDDNTDGKPYGVDVVMPMKMPTEGTSVDLQAMIPPEHVSFVDRTLQKLGVPPLPEGEGREGVLGWLHSIARSHVDIALAHRPVLIANALGSPPVDVIEQAHARGVKVAALAGAAKHAVSHVHNGVDVIVAQGYEAGGHTGEIAGMVLTPEIVDAVGPAVPVLGAGGIGTGRQIAASLALGAQGVWTGSIWLTVEEYDLSAGVGIRDAFLRAGSSDTVRTRIYTGKPARLLKTKWTEAWEAEDAPEPLPMPLQNLLVADAHNRMNRGRRPRHDLDAGGPDRGPDERGAPRRGGHGPAGRGVRTRRSGGSTTSPRPRSRIDSAVRGRTPPMDHEAAPCPPAGHGGRRAGHRRRPLRPRRHRIGHRRRLPRAHAPG